MIFNRHLIEFKNVYFVVDNLLQARYNIADLIVRRYDMGKTAKLTIKTAV